MDAIDKLKEYKVLIISSIILIVSILFFVSGKQDNKAVPQNERDLVEELLSTDERDNSDEAVKESVNEISSILVDVKGAVKHPGVYQLTGNSRVIDAINVAGGLKDEAMTKHVNFAKQVVDEMLIYIPVEGEETTDILPLDDGDTLSQKVNINTASTKELESLSGIGPQKAREIIRYREEKGNFKAIEELTNVSGIGVKTFEKLKDDITVD